MKFVGLREKRVTAQSSPWKAMQAGGPSLDKPSDAGDASAIAPMHGPSALDDASSASMLPEPDGWTDALTGAGGPRFWHRVLTNEEARRRRYDRTATVAIVEFTGFESNGSWLSRDLGLTFFTRVARVFVKEVRSSDHVARIGPARFGIILVETDEVAAINFVDRLRQTCVAELGSNSDFAVRIGWASPPAGGSLDDAFVIAEARLAE